MSRIIIQTLVINKSSKRRISFLGNKGVDMAQGESVVLEGAYPIACKTPGQASAMQYEYDNGLIDVKLVTNLEIIRSSDYVQPVDDSVAVADIYGGQARQPDNIIKGTSEKGTVVKPVAGSETASSDTNVVNNSGVFSKGTIKDALPKATPIGGGQTIPEDKPARTLHGESISTTVVSKDDDIVAPVMVDVNMMSDPAIVGHAPAAPVEPVAPAEEPSVLVPVVKVKAPSKVVETASTVTPESSASKKPERRRAGSKPASR